MTTIKLAFAAGASLLLLAGCANSPTSPDGQPAGYFRTTTVKVGDREIPCITWKQGHGGGISCDWGVK